MPDRAPPEAALPEFTRSLRAFATPGALGSGDHDALFAPLLAARKSASRVQTIEGRLAAFDPARLRDGLRSAIDAMCERRAPRSASDRRALVARIAELAALAFDALDAMERSATAVRAASDEARAAAWDAWVAAVQSLFDATDGMLAAAHGALPPVSARRRPFGGATQRALIAGVLAGGTAFPLGAQHVPVRIAGVRAESLLAHGFDVVGAEPNAVIVVADPAQRARLATLGWGGTVVLPPGAPRERALGLQLATTPAVYRDYDDPVRGVRAFIDSMARNNPRISVDTIGRTYEGRPMLAVKVGPKGDGPARPNVIIMATYHAREWAATEMALRLLRYLATPLPGDTRVDSLVQARDIWIVPVANPDGYQYTFTADRLWRKTRSPQAGGAVGVDMNRNHRQNWGLDDFGSSNDPGSETYRGPSPASEVEVRNIEAFHAAHPPVVSISYHTYAGLLLYPPGAIYGQLPADLPVYRTLAGTNRRSAVQDRVPGSARTFYSPSSAWMLYTTNGEYNDWTSVQYRTISFTPEITSGYTGGSYYGFEFPDNEALLARLFDDNLPFALDVVESAGDPYGYVSPTTLTRSDRIVLESVSPDVRVTVQADAASTAHLASPLPLAFHVDSAAGGRYTRRLVSGPSNRPHSVSVAAAGQTATFSVLEINGAERTESGWTTTGAFRLDSSTVAAGAYSWLTPGGGALRSPVVHVPADVDTVSLAFWTRYTGSGYTESPYGEVRMSTDGGSVFQSIQRLQGFAPTWYPENVTIGGVKGKQLVFQFLSTALPWNLDEIAIVAHGAVTAAPAVAPVALVPSENPVRHGLVFFPWPFSSPVGDLQVFDFSGRLVWRTTVTTGATVKWDLRAANLANGVYVVVARSGSQALRLKLYVVRNAS